MGFESSRRYGRFWDDAKSLDGMINNFLFHTTGKNERDFENCFASTLMNGRDKFKSQVITQIDKSTTVKSVYCFGKKHRPDMTLAENGIAIELKFINYAGLKGAIGQGYLYRLQYRFVFLVLIVSEDKKTIYEDLCDGKEKDLEDTLQHLADNMNIFTYIVPAFYLKKPGMKKCYSYFEPINEIFKANEDKPLIT